MPQKYFLYWSYGSCQEVKEFIDYDEMIECVRKHVEQEGYVPTVYYGEKLEFEPAEIVKSWKIKDRK